MIEKGARILCESGHHIATFAKSIEVGEVIQKEHIEFEPSQPDIKSLWEASKPFITVCERCGRPFAYLQEEGSAKLQFITDRRDK